MKLHAVMTTFFMGKFLSENIRQIKPPFIDLLRSYSSVISSAKSNLIVFLE